MLPLDGLAQLLHGVLVKTTLDLQELVSLLDLEIY